MSQARVSHLELAFIEQMEQAVGGPDASIGFAAPQQRISPGHSSTVPRIPSTVAASSCSLGLALFR